MDKETKVDNILVEMIQPKIKEIEEKFSKGQKLEQEDINTLLLKSQYNHINHLDQKLDEVAASVVALEGKFHGLENKVQDQFQKLENEFHSLENKVQDQFQGLENKFYALRNDVQEQIHALENKIDKSRNEMQEQIHALERKIDKLELKFTKLEGKFDLLKAELKTEIKEAINSNMRWSVAMITLLVLGLKLIDILL